MEKPQVFINFRGKDERKKLLPHLKHHLQASLSNVKVFTDDDAVGQPLESLFKHIRNSKMVIVIFSVNYLESDWCLDELVEIRKCLETEKIEFAIPIFYKVEASDVKLQSGQFGERFLTLKNKYPDSKIKKWKKALGVVAEYIGVTYEKTSSLSELDFVKIIVDKVDGILAGTESKKEVNKTITETSERKAGNSIVFDYDMTQLHLSKTLEALNLERSYFEGVMHGAAWKDLISSMQSSNRFEISPPENSLQFPMNFQSFYAQANDSIEKAINILALRMMRDQTQPALIFSNWDKLDHDTKNSIIYSAGKKSKMISKILKGYNGGVDSESHIPPNLFPFVQEPIWDKSLEPMVPQDRPRHDHRRANSFHDNRDQFYPLPYEMFRPVETPVVSQRSIDSTGQTDVGSKRRDDNPSFISSMCHCFNCCLA